MERACRVCERSGAEERIHLTREHDPPVDWSLENPVVDCYSESIPVVLCARPECRAKWLEVQRERGMVEPRTKWPEIQRGAP